MNRKLPVFLVAVSAACAAQQQPASSALPAAQAALQTVYHAGPDVVAPELIPPQISLEKIHHCKKLDGKPVIALIVDAKGDPSNLSVTQPADGNLNEAALVLVRKDRFKPGTHNGVPAVVAIEIEVDLKTCSLYSPEENGVFTLASLREQPTQRVTVIPPLAPEIAQVLAEPSGSEHPGGLGPGSPQNGTVTAPVPLNAVTAHYTPAAKKARITGICLVQVIVGADGLPKNPRIIKSLDPDLDQEALKAVMQYQFKPAMRSGQPVPVQITIEITFKLY